MLAEALASIGCPAAKIQSAGRTDAGVHAEGQVASIELERALEAHALLRALHARLPRDVAVTCVAEVAPGWHAPDAARANLDRERIWNGAVRSPLRESGFAWIPEPLAVDRMRAAAAFVGTHDFSALRAAGCSARTSLRSIRAIELTGEGARHEIAVDVLGEGFHRYKVRNLAGTLIEVGRGRFEVAEAVRILDSRDRGPAGRGSFTGRP